MLVTPLFTQSLTRLVTFSVFAPVVDGVMVPTTLDAESALLKFPTAQLLTPSRFAQVAPSPVTAPAPEPSAHAVSMRRTSSTWFARAVRTLSCKVAFVIVAPGGTTPARLNFNSMFLRRVGFRLVNPVVLAP